MKIHSYQDILFGKDVKLQKNPVPVRNGQRLGGCRNRDLSLVSRKESDRVEKEDHNRITTFLVKNWSQIRICSCNYHTNHYNHR